MQSQFTVGNQLRRQGRPARGQGRGRLDRSAQGQGRASGSLHYLCAPVEPAWRLAPSAAPARRQPLLISPTHRCIYTKREQQERAGECRCPRTLTAMRRRQTAAPRAGTMRGTSNRQSLSALAPLQDERAVHHHEQTKQEKHGRRRPGDAAEQREHQEKRDDGEMRRPPSRMHRAERCRSTPDAPSRRSARGGHIVDECWRRRTA